jgi:predicted permease
MSTFTVFQQMLIMIIMIIIGYCVYKKGFIGEEGAKNMSFLVLNITNPAFVISSAFSEDVTVTHDEIIFALVLTVVFYIVLTAFGHVLPYILGAKKGDRVSYTMLCVYSNVGFIGIPVVSAVLGGNALMYVTVFNIIYTLLFYSHGYMCMLKGVKRAHYKLSVKSFINVGTVAAIIAIIIFWFDIKLPMFVEDTVTYIGRATTFMAMIVLGISFAKLPIKKLICNARIYIMEAVRFVVFPIVITLITKTLIDNEVAVYTVALMAAMPAGNSPLMLATRYDINTDTMSSGILVSTVLSVITVTLTMLVI